MWIQDSVFWGGNHISGEGGGGKFDVFFICVCVCLGWFYGGEFGILDGENHPHEIAGINTAYWRCEDKTPCFYIYIFLHLQARGFTNILHIICHSVIRLLIGEFWFLSDNLLLCKMLHINKQFVVKINIDWKICVKKYRRVTFCFMWNSIRYSQWDRRDRHIEAYGIRRKSILTRS